VRYLGAARSASAAEHPKDIPSFGRVPANRKKGGPKPPSRLARVDEPTPRLRFPWIALQTESRRRVHERGSAGGEAEEGGRVSALTFSRYRVTNLLNNSLKSPALRFPSLHAKGERRWVGLPHSSRFPRLSCSAQCFGTLRAIRDGATRLKVCGSDWTAKDFRALDAGIARTVLINAAGVELINGDQPEVRLRKSKGAAATAGE
jgi:hypothetical protein